MGFVLIAFVVRVMFLDLSLLAFLAILISIYQFSLLFISIGHIIPTRHLLGSFMCIQFFVGPTMVYNGLEKYQYFMYRMRIPESQYLEYVLPAVCLFIVGLHLNAGKYRGEVVNRKAIEFFTRENPKLPYLFIIIGFLASVISSYFGSELGFVFYLLGSFKFIGLFLLVLGTKQIKPLTLAVILGSILSSSLSSGMFHDLLTWLVYISAVFAIKYKFDFKIKMIGLSAFVLIVVIIQALKGTYRAEIGRGQAEEGTAAFEKAYQEKDQEGGIFTFSSLASNVTRINQGFIITNIMVTVPDIVPFADGEEMDKILEAAIMPRIFAPNKLKAGDRSIFVKYSHIPLSQGTSMGLSSIGDAYVNYGVFGGVIFMFILGCFYCEVLNSFNKNSLKYPVLILFVPLVFYYPIRPDCELQTILTHLVKSCVLIFALMQMWKYQFRVYYNFNSE